MRGWGGGGGGGCLLLLPSYFQSSPPSSSINPTLLQNIKLTAVIYINVH